MTLKPSKDLDTAYYKQTLIQRMRKGKAIAWANLSSLLK